MSCPPWIFLSENLFQSRFVFVCGICNIITSFEGLSRVKFEDFNINTWKKQNASALVLPQGPERAKKVILFFLIIHFVCVLV